MLAEETKKLQHNMNMTTLCVKDKVQNSINRECSIVEGGGEGGEVELSLDECNQSIISMLLLW